MAKKKYEKHYDQNLVDALKKLPSPIYDKKHQFYIYFINDRARTNETRFEHIAKRGHELKVRDIDSINDGINGYLYFVKSPKMKDTYYYYLKRKGMDKGFVQVAIKLLKGKTKKYYVKTIYIVYRINGL